MEGVWGVFGCGPDNVTVRFINDLELHSKFSVALQDPKTVALGVIGLDYR